MAKEVILLFFIICIVLFYVSGAPLGRAPRNEHYTLGKLDRPQPPPASPANPHPPVFSASQSRVVNFAEDVQQRRYSKRTGRIIGADTVIPINDSPVGLAF